MTYPGEPANLSTVRANVEPTPAERRWTDAVNVLTSATGDADRREAIYRAKRALDAMRDEWEGVTLGGTDVLAAAAGLVPLP